MALNGTNVRQLLKYSDNILAIEADRKRSLIYFTAYKDIQVCSYIGERKKSIPFKHRCLELYLEPHADTLYLESGSHHVYSKSLVNHEEEIELKILDTQITFAPLETLLMQ